MSFFWFNTDLCRRMGSRRLAEHCLNHGVQAHLIDSAKTVVSPGGRIPDRVEGSTWIQNLVIHEEPDGFWLDGADVVITDTTFSVDYLLLTTPWEKNRYEGLGLWYLGRNTTTAGTFTVIWETTGIFHFDWGELQTNSWEMLCQITG